MKLGDLLGDEPRAQELPLLRRLLLVHRRGVVRLQALERLRRIASGGAVSGEEVLDQPGVRVFVRLPEPAYFAAVAAADRRAGTVENGEALFARVLKAASPGEEHVGPLLVGLLAGDEHHPVALRELGRALAAGQDRARILAAVAGLVDLARTEGRELHGGSFLELARPWLHDEDAAVSVAAGAVVLALYPQHPEGQRWRHRWLGESFATLEPHLWSIVPRMVGTAEARGLARLLHDQLRTTPWMENGSTWVPVEWIRKLEKSPRTER